MRELLFTGKGKRRLKNKQKQRGDAEIDGEAQA